jgi:hypothetical protein
VGAVASGSGECVTTLSPAHVVRGPTDLPWLSAHLREIESGRYKAVTNQASFRVEPLSTRGRCELCVVLQSIATVTRWAWREGRHELPRLSAQLQGMRT